MFDLKDQKTLSIFESSVNKHAIVSVADVAGNIIYANQRFCEISGYTEKELLGKNHRIVSSGEHDKDFFQNMWKTISSGETWNGTIKNKRKNGEPYWVEATIVPVLNEKNKPYQYIAIRTDVTEQVLAKAVAEKANFAKSKFLSSMSHELRTPLNAILGFSQLLGLDKNGVFSERQHKQIHQIQDAGKHLLQLIDEVLDLAKIETGKFDFNITDVNLREIIENSIELTSDLTLKNSVSVSIPNIIPDICVKADHLRLKQVILNLLSNAIKYNRKDGEVWIDCHIIEGMVCRISIVDTGIGIPENMYADVFESFKRLGAENSSVEGTGIGLSLTNAIVTEMNGDIGFCSVEGKSTTFWIELPLSNAPSKLPTSGKESEFPLECCGDKHTVLYIEDNKTNIELMEGLVDIIPNLEMVFALSGTEGIALAERIQPHMIILDMNLPDISGFEVFKRLKENVATRQIEVIALSADAMPETIEKARQLGISEYLTKPFRIKDVIDVLNRYIED
jgi:PAS domain S-box-containing protein